MDVMLSSSGLLPLPFTSPHRHFMMPGGYESIPNSPPMKDMLMYPWNWGMGAQKMQFSPSGSFSSIESEQTDTLPVESNFGQRHSYERNDSYSSFEGFGSPTTPRRPLQNIPPSPQTPQQNTDDAESLLNFNLKRGRPRADSISNLIVESSQSPSSIRCKICHRVFPREKSLQAHMRTHTGERPYICDYPGCGRAFCQSGQLKTHQRLHTGEKPFKCSATGCESRFTHANRHCQAHPGSQLVRVDPAVLYPSIPQDENNIAVLEWLNKHVESRRETGSNPRRVKRALNVSATSDQNTETQESGVKRLRMDDEEDHPDVTRPDEEVIAEPLDLSDKTGRSSDSATTSLRSLQEQEISLNESGCSPSDKRAEPEEDETILGALALMELAKNRLWKPSSFRL
ncbi:zinc finger protein 367-like [Lineus longissimus]|uniref:zinc finger protein 367-like n=1 Tax=Lineus longissimus TaxID=88925 RepID=UPI002B4E8C64